MRGGGLEHHAHARREDRAFDVAELVDAAARREAELVHEVFPVQVGAELVAVRPLRERDVEVVAPDVAAVGEDVARRDDVRVAQLEVVGLGLEVEPDRPERVRVGDEQVRRARVEEVRKGAQAQRALAVGDAAVRHVGRALQPERADAGVDDAGRPVVAALVEDPASALEVLVDAERELRLLGALVAEATRLVRVGREGGAADRHAPGDGRAARGPARGDAERVAVERNLPGRARVGIRPEVARVEAVRPGVVDRVRVREGAVPLVAVAVSLTRAAVAVEQPSAQHQPEALVLARRLGDDVDDAVHGVGAPDDRRGTAHHLDLLDLAGGRRGHEVPEHEAEEVEVDGAAVDGDELRGRQRRGRLPRGEVDVARRHLDHVEAGHRAQRVGHVLRGLARERLARHDAHRGRGVDQLLLDLAGALDGDFFRELHLLVGLVGRRLLWRSRRRLRLGASRRPGVGGPCRGRSAGQQQADPRESQQFAPHRYLLTALEFGRLTRASGHKPGKCTRFVAQIPRGF